MIAGKRSILQTALDGVRMSSRWQTDRGLSYNWFFVEGTENIVIDPFRIEEGDIAALESAGRAAWIVVTGSDYVPEARALAGRLGAKVAGPASNTGVPGAAFDRELRDGDQIGRARVVTLQSAQASGRIGFHLSDCGALIVGRALVGDPPGALRVALDLNPGESARFIGSLRALWALRAKHLLVAEGTCIFGAATGVVGAFLESRSDVYINRINADDLEWRNFSDDPEPFGGSAAEIGRLIGATKLGYHLVKLPPGRKWCPFHWHEFDEELFFIMEGTATLRTPRGEYRVRRGDFIAFPTGPGGAHQLRNDSADDCTILMLASNDDGEDVCHYPDSRKVNISGSKLCLREEPRLDYYDGEL